MNSPIVDFTGFTVEFSSLRNDAYLKAIFDSKIDDVRPHFLHNWSLCRNNETGNHEFWLVTDHFERGQWEGQKLEQTITVSREVATVLSKNFKDRLKQGVETQNSLEKTPEPSNEIENALQELIRKVMKRNKSGEEIFWSDVEHDLKELISCLRNNLRRATLALCGRILELSLKIDLKINEVPFEKGWGVGKLLSTLKENNVYADDALINIYNVINKQRIIGVHAAELVPIPSKHQVFLVVHGVIDTLDRTLSRRLTENEE